MKAYNTAKDAKEGYETAVEEWKDMYTRDVSEMRFLRSRLAYYDRESKKRNAERTRELVSICEGRPCVFHRALDVTPDWKQALDTLISLGVTRVLTSGQESDVFFALDTIREMIEYVNGAIEILPGAGITLRNVERVKAATGCTQVHLARHKTLPDRSVSNNRSIYYGGALYPPEDIFEVTDSDYVAAVRARLDG